jgi:cobalt/nickel transport system permease protein
MGLNREKLELAAGLGCLVFAAQAINVPVGPAVSAHLVGGVLLAWMLGPALGAWTMALVVAVQAIALGDGGISALGANVLNMALLPAGIVAVAQRLASLSTKSLQPLAAVGIAASMAVPLAAVLIVAEMALFRPAAELSGWTSFVATMLGTHAWIGVLEGGLTVVLVGALTPLASRVSQRPAWKPALVGIAAGLLLLAFLLPVSSALPDGYEAAAQASGMGWLIGP